MSVRYMVREDSFSGKHEVLRINPGGFGWQVNTYNTIEAAYYAAGALAVAEKMDKESESVV